MKNYNLCLIKYVVFILIGVSFFILATENNTFARPAFKIATPKLGLGFIYEFDSEKNTGPDVNTQSERNEFRERLEIETNGWIYHPALCTFELEYSPELIQRIEETKTFEDNREGKNNTTVQGYNFSTNILPNKPYTLTLFGRKRDVPQISAFSRVSDKVFESVGASLDLKYRLLPTSLSYSQSTTDQKGFYDSSDESEVWRLKSRHKTKKSNTFLDTSYEERIYTTAGAITTDIESFNSNISNEYNIAGDRRIVLNSYLGHRLTDDNVVESSGLQISENLGWAHRKNLTTNYSINYGKNESGDFFNEVTNYRAGLNHGLYDNLTTSVSGYGENYNFTSGGRETYGGSLNFNYSRPIPIGNLGLNMGYGYRRRSNDFDFIPVLNAEYTLTGFDFTLLDDKFIDIDSIKVTNPGGTIIYTKDIDYKVEEVNFFVTIRRVLGSTIPDPPEGATVLVSYLYLSGASYDDATLTQRYGFSLNLWSSLMLSYQYENSKQKLISGIPPETLEDDTTHRAELELLWRFTNTIFSYENADRSAGNSTERWRVEEILTFVPISQVFLRFRGDVAHYIFKNGIDDTQDSFNVGFSMDWTPKTWAKLGMSASHFIASGDSIDREDTAISANLEMTYFIWNFSFRYLFLNQNDRIENETRQVNNILFEIVKLNF